MGAPASGAPVVPTPLLILGWNPFPAVNTFDYLCYYGKKSFTMAVLLYLHVQILQMNGGGWKGLIFVLISAHALFCLATATTCTSQSKLPTLFSPGSVNGLLTQVLVCNYY